MSQFARERCSHVVRNGNVVPLWRAICDGVCGGRARVERCADPPSRRRREFSSDLLHQPIELRSQLSATGGELLDRRTARAGRRNLASDARERELQTFDLEVAT